MKRSRVNDIMAHADEMIRSFGFKLPPFAYWTPKEFYENRSIADHIIDANVAGTLLTSAQEILTPWGYFYSPYAMADWQICSVVVACAMLKSF